MLLAIPHLIVAFLRAHAKVGAKMRQISVIPLKERCKNRIYSTKPCNIKYSITTPDRVPLRIATADIHQLIEYQ